MSRIFYDRHVNLEHIQKEIDKLTENKEEREELYHIVDEYVHHKMLGCILGKLHKDHHEEFLTKFTEAPHSDHLWDYLREKVEGDVEQFVRDEVYEIGTVLLGTIKGKSVTQKHDK
jgi:hypothetical protein